MFRDSGSWRQFVSKENVGFQLTLKNVRYVPKLHLNLMSINVFDKEGFHKNYGSRK